MKRILAIIAVVALALSLIGCADGGKGSSEVGSGHEIVPIDVTDLSGGVAAEVGEVQIGENAITAYINNFRYANGLQDETEWGQWIFDTGYSMDGLRSDTVEMFVNQELIRQACEQEGITVSDEEVDAKIAESRGDASDEEYAAALEEQGLDEAAYRENVRLGLLQEKLAEKVAGGDKVDDATVLEYLKLYFPNEVDQDATTLDGIDEERIKSVRELVEGFNSNQAFSQWMMDFRKKSDVVTYMMPEGLPYVVDLAPYEKAYYAALEQENASSSGDAQDSSASDSASSSSASEGA